MGGAASKIADHEYLHTLGPKISGQDTDTNILPVSYAASGKTGEQYLDTGRILPRWLPEQKIILAPCTWTESSGTVPE